MTEYTSPDGTITYDITQATVGVDDPKRAYRVDKTDNTNGSWCTVASGLTRKEAKQRIADLAHCYEDDSD